MKDLEIQEVISYDVFQEIGNMIKVLKGVYMQNIGKEFPFPDRDREKCKQCNYYNYLYCSYVKIDGFCSLTGNKVRS